MTLGKTIDFKNSKTGDLLFQGPIGTNKITHTGIILLNENGDRYIAHSKQQVRVNKLGKEGIYPQMLGVQDVKEVKRFIEFV